MSDYTNFFLNNDDVSRFSLCTSSDPTEAKALYTVVTTASGRKQATIHRGPDTSGAIVAEIEFRTLSSDVVTFAGGEKILVKKWLRAPTLGHLCVFFDLDRPETEYH
jgi:hypothetical protein